ncbi:MAG: RNA polymerase sigma factor [Oscillospiraceae bacterium]
MDDQKIVALYWARSEEAVAETAKKYSGYCRSIAYNILQNREDAEECVNDAYIRAWGAIPPHRPERLSAFLGKITRNLALQRYLKNSARKRGGGEAALSLAELEECLPAAGGDGISDDIALREALERFLRAQPKEARVLFTLRYFYMYPISQIAAKLGMSESRVKSALFRLRKKLRAHLEKEGIML